MYPLINSAPRFFTLQVFAMRLLLSGPGQGVGFYHGKKFHRFQHTFFNRVATVFNATEWRHLYAEPGLFPDITSANIQPLNEGHNTIQVIGTHTG